jgi:hypothetical protein
MKKLVQVFQILEKKKSKSSYFYDKFQWVAKKIEEFF